MKSISEYSAIKLFTEEFGTDVKSRLLKLMEEVYELEAEFNKPEMDEEAIKDELSDVQGCFTHLASLFGMYQSEMLKSCTDKVVKRKTDPNYKRY